MSNFFSRFLRSLSRGCVSWTLLVLVFWPLLITPAQAAAGIPTMTMEDIPRKTEFVADSIWTSLTRVAMVGFFNAAQTFFGQLAYDAADYIATGGSGKSATYFKKGFTQYLAGVASDSMGEFIGSLSNEQFFRTAGLDLCRPSARQLLRLQLSLGNFFPGMQSKFQRPTPKCNFKDIIKNYDKLYQSMSNGDVLKNIQFSVNTNSSDLGVAFNILNQAQQKLTLDVSNKKLERGEGGGFKAITSILSGNIKTPAQVVNESAKDTLVRFPKESTLTMVGATLSSGMQQGFSALLEYTASIFFNTLISKLLKRVFEDGLDEAVAQLQSNADQVAPTRQTDTRNVTVSLKTPNLQKIENINVMADLASCSTGMRGIWNCTLDQGLRSALVRTDQGNVSIRTALEKRLLHGDWPLIPISDIRRNQDRECYTKAYCAGNLQKLRLLRILPIGFEMAANSAENVRRCSPQGEGCVTLQEVVDGFSACKTTEISPWCHLIDPDWILAALPQQCVLKGYGDQLISSTLGQRYEECQDVQTCLRRNDRMECVGGYGYCVAEKTAYRFGADECLPRQASCRTYQTRAGDDVSYLRNTTDQATCSIDNVGCLWYATTRDPSRGEESWIGTTSTGSRVYFNAKLDTCAASAEGCTKVREAVIGRSSLNLVVNGSFERTTEDTSPLLQNWTIRSAHDGSVEHLNPPTAVTGTAYLDGERAADLNNGREGMSSVIYSQALALNPAHSYVLSFSVRAKVDGPAGRANILVREFSDALRSTEVSDPRAYKSAGCSEVAGGRGVRKTGMDVQIPMVGQSSNWKRFECTFVTTSSTEAGILTIFGGVSPPNNNALVDNVQLEEGEYATDFVDGINESTNTQGRLWLAERHIKIAPDEFACSGESTDPAVCDKFAKVCRQIEAGCDGYTDAITGGNQIPAILSAQDLCPSQCVGYAEYRKSPSAFDLVADANPTFNDPNDVTSTYFIPATAASCRRQDVGCEAFTNVEGAMGESQAYLTYARSCRKPSANSQTFFTWEGSDTSGYQLRTWSLVHDAAVPPEPLRVIKREPGSSFVKDYRMCDAERWGVRPAPDPDCRQFYDADGHVSYRYYSQTVLSTPACSDFRMVRSNVDDCRKTDGEFDAVASECLYHIYLPQSQLCTASAVGCREYRGVTAGANLPIIQENFRGVSDTRGFRGARLSSETLLVGDQSLRLDVPTTGASVSSTFVTPTGDHQYSVTFWAKNALTTSTVLQVNVCDFAGTSCATPPAGSVLLTTDWQRYTVGPFSGYQIAPTSSLVWTAVPNRTNAYAVFLDEISLVRIQDRTYVRRNTWQTPDVCDQNAYGVPQPQAMLGCRTYRNRANQSVNVKDFTRLCREVAIGCKGFVDTRNSSDVGQQVFERNDVPAIPGFGTATTTRPADRMRYLIDEPSANCTRDEDSCRAVGKPGFSADRVEVTGFTTMYVKDDIADYSNLLCRPSELFCDAFTHEDSPEYFRNPDNHICAYRENVTGVAPATGGTYAGWFEVGSNPPKACYPTLLQSGQTFGIARRADPMYRGWVGLCEASAAECTELRDPIDSSDHDHPSGKPYFFIRNEHLNTAWCANGVDRANGCVLMRDVGSEDVRFNTRATYAAQRAMVHPASVQPIDCVRNPTDPNCRAQTGTCFGTIRRCRFDDRDCRNSLPISVSMVSPGVYSGNTWPTSLADVISPDDALRARLLNCHSDSDCNDGVSVIIHGDYQYNRTGVCRVENDANLIVKVNVDRDCAQWLGCSSSEVVFNPATNRSQSLCTNVALCDKGGQGVDDQYCSGYVNRDSTSTEPILAKGTALTQPLYISRNIDLGQKDYSGYAIPNAFLPIDMINARVAIDGTNGDSRATGNFARDYRLVTTVTMPRASHVTFAAPSPCAQSDACFTHNQPPLSNQAKILDRGTRLGAAYPNLHLCQHLQTNLVGYFIPTNVGATSTNFCYLAASFDPTTVSDPDVRRSPYDFTSLALGFTETNPNNNGNNSGFVQRAFPVAECRANPEADAPFDAKYVTQWDLAKNPPKPTQRVPGFTRVNVCEYGQACSCTYKRADYGEAAVSKFFEANAQTVPSGICAGGSRDGEACVIGATAGNSATGTHAAETALASLNCGDAQFGGHCVSLSRIETVRGMFGQCLERDVTRTVTVGNMVEQPCLTWSPGAILFGEHDIYHYSPSAGYQPPQGSGAYYCISAAQKSHSTRLHAYDFEGVEPPPPSPLSETNYPAFSGQMHKITFDDDYVSHESENKSGAASILGENGHYSIQAEYCENADEEQENDGNRRDADGLRLVGTGIDIAHSYTEAFFKIHQVNYVRDISLGSEPSLDAGLSDNNIGYIQIQPFKNPNGMGRLACGYQADWVDGLAAIDYDSPDELRAGDANWRAAFFANYSPLLTRASEELLKDERGPIERPCVSNSATESTTCRFKTWELGYRSKGQTDLFTGAIGPSSNGLAEGFAGLRKHSFSGVCLAEKPYFGIRAVFETVVTASTALNTSSGGLWKFVGLWVASCAGRVNDVRYMYMNVDVVSADICREIAEVRSKDSLQDAAYTDRVWSTAAYTAPRIGTQYGTKHSPFSSILTSRPISEAGIEPLFQTGADIAGFSPLHPPTFLASGSDTYHRPEQLPKDKWAYLSNLFARVYRVYRYYDKEVTLDSTACLDGPFKGTMCTPLSLVDAQLVILERAQGQLNAMTAARRAAETWQAGAQHAIDATLIARRALTAAEADMSAAEITAARAEMTARETSDSAIFREAHQQLIDAQDAEAAAREVVRLANLEAVRLMADRTSAGERARSGPSAQCSINGKCDPALLDSTAINTFKVCDSMSGLNAGLSCADDEDMCHTGATFFDAGVAHQKLRACILNVDDWAQNPVTGTYDIRRTSGVETFSASEASSHYTSPTNQGSSYTVPPPFICDGGMRTLARGNVVQDCSAPSFGAGSRECPEEVHGKCVITYPPGSSRSPVPFVQRFTSLVADSILDKSNKCALPHYISNGDPTHPQATHIATDTEVPVRTGSEYRYVDPGTHLVYDVVAGGGYTTCLADYDCSFTPYNYYMKRTNGYAPLYSFRSRQFMFQRTGSPRDYGSRSSSTPCSGDECMYETSVDVRTCEGGSSYHNQTDNPRHAATQLPTAVFDEDILGSETVPSRNPNSLYQHIVGAPYAFVNGHDLPESMSFAADQGDAGYCAIQAWRRGYYTTVFTARSYSSAFADSSNRCGGRDFDDALNAISLQDSLSEVTREPGVDRAALAGVGSADLATFWGCTASAIYLQIPFGRCISPPQSSHSRNYGRCRGGLKNGSLCQVDAAVGQQYSCAYKFSDPVVAAWATPMLYDQLGNRPEAPYMVTHSNPLRSISTIGDYEDAVNRCGPVSISLDGHTLNRPVAACAQDIHDDRPTGSADLDNDNNICTHTAGYHPRVDLCPDPSDEFCGLIAYKRGDMTSLNPAISPFPMPTDVTVGHYTPDYLMSNRDRASFFAGGSDYTRDNFKYVNYYRPYPPQVAALDVNQCPQSGQCSVTRAATFNFNGQTEGPMTIAGGQHKSTIQFYAWAAHNQMPIRRMTIDWGDGFVQNLPNAKIKNHKPYCGVTKECAIVSGPNRGPTGLTCASDNDCPLAYGRCEDVGTCAKQADKTCSKDTDCTENDGPVGDKCTIRQFFGNSSDACEQNYFEFSHVYTCDGQRSVAQVCGGLPDLDSGTDGGGHPMTFYRCARNPEKACNPRAPGRCGVGEACLLDLAPKGGCWDQTTLACRFTPRVLIEDNWGWCTGECRTNYRTIRGTDGAADTFENGDDLSDVIGGNMVPVSHPYGGCYSGIPISAAPGDAVRLNTNGLPLTVNECNADFPEMSGDNSKKRPWIVYPGSLQLRSR